jgi:sugar phosphate isomerase/epimerase
MRLGISSYTFPWAIGIPPHVPPAPMTHFDLLAATRTLGVTVVQICDNLPLTALDRSGYARVMAAAQAHGIQLEIGTRGIAPENLQRHLALAVQAQSPIVRVVIDTTSHHPSPDAVIRRISAVMPEYEAEGITLAIENHDRFTTKTLLAILRTVGSPCLGICLDTVNSFGALEGPEAVVTALAPWTVNLHVKDAAVVRSCHQLGFTIEGRPAGQGQLDIPWLLAMLRATGREVNAILELWPPLLPDLEDTIRLEARWAEESIAYLRTLIPERT